MNKFPSKTIITAFAALVLAAACSDQTDTAPAKESLPLISGIDLSGMDTSVRPQDDFYRYANGKWLETTEIPADEVGWGSYMTLRKESLEQSRVIVEDAAADHQGDPARKKIGDYYNAFIDEARIEKLGIEPVADYLEQIDNLKTHSDIVAFFGSSNPAGIDAPFNLYVGQDDKDATSYILHLVQSGLGLPDRDYYSDNSERGVEIIGRYKSYLADILALAGHTDATAAAERIFALESQLAEHQWNKIDNRDADKRYNKVTASEFLTMLSNLDVETYLMGIGIDLPENVIVVQPSYLSAFNQLFTRIEVDSWKDYLRANVLSSYASYLPKAFVESRFDFYSKFLYGRQEQQPRWRKAINSINGNLGELLGQLYVAKHFSPDSKARMITMVDNLIAAYAESIKNLDWMSEETKQQSLVKLSKFTPKIGYPDKWKDYSSLTV
ncbi:MAG: peptidase M13, partial [Porticoccaceae bacterium]